MNRLFRGLITAIVLALVLGSGPVGAIPPPCPPGMAYQQYLGVMRDAANLSDVLPYLSRGARSEVEKAAGSDAAEWLKFLQVIYPREVRVVRESLSGDRATVFAEGVSADPFDKTGRLDKTYGTIELIMEDGGWKIDNESWGNRPPGEPDPAAASPAPASPTPACPAPAHASPAPAPASPPPAGH